jgi:hypothetical protein
MLCLLRSQSANSEHSNTSSGNTANSRSTAVIPDTDAAVTGGAVIAANVHADVASTASTTSVVTASSAKQDRLMAALTEASQANKLQVHKPSAHLLELECADRASCARVA